MKALKDTINQLTLGNMSEFWLLFEVYFKNELFGLARMYCTVFPINSRQQIHIHTTKQFYYIRR